MAARRAPLGLLIIVPVVVGLGVYAFTGQEPVVDPTATQQAATATPEATATVDYAATSIAGQATAVAAYPTPTPGITQRGDFRAGAWVRVTTGDGDCLNARLAPSTTNEYASVSLCLPEGYEGLIVSEAQEADGRWWWRLAGAGWVAEEYLTFVRDVDLRAPMAPQYAAVGGHVAFIRDGGSIWIMRPDGSEQRELVPPQTDSNGYNVWPSELTWSPDGTLLSYNLNDYGSADEPPSMALHVVDLTGNNRVLARAAGRGWSLDSRRIGVIVDPAPQQMGGGWQGLPAFVDVATGEISYYGDPGAWDDAWFQDPPAVNHDGTLVLLKYSRTLPDGTYETAIFIGDEAGNEVARIASQGDTWDSSPIWSPTANRIGFFRSTSGETPTGGFVVYDLQSGAFIASAPLPAISPSAGGKCGGGDMWRPGWSRDGRYLLYGLDNRTTGNNGLWSLDASTGATHVAQAQDAFNVSAGPGGTTAFSAAGYVFIATEGDAFPTLITDGHSPVWSSGQ